MGSDESNLDRLLKARAVIDDELRRQKLSLTVLFTDLVGSTAYFDRFGDTAGLALVQRHAGMAAQAVAEFDGRVIKTIGDSVMAVFQEPVAAVRAAREMQRRLVQLNQSLPQRERHQFRIGINHGLVYDSGSDVYGDAVNVAARITKHTGPAQILLSQSVWERLRQQDDLEFACIGKLSFHGKTEQQDLYELYWTDRESYALLRKQLAAESGSPKSVSAGEAAAASSTPLSTAPEPFLGSPTLRARYEVLCEAGRGGMGIVYQARDRETAEIVALKILRPELAVDPAAIEQFKKELRLARRITHKNVCRIFDFHRADNTACISMEFVEGESLRRVLNRFRTLSIAKGIEIAQQVCAGLREAHSQGIIHRDLKPENIMIDAAGNVKVMDFGIARLAGSSTLPAAVALGTPAYMSPEQVESQQVSASTDIYALGLVLYEMFTGAPAFAGDTPIAVALKQIRETPRLPHGEKERLPAHLASLILKCLEKDPVRRFQSVEELEAALAGEPRAAAVGMARSLPTIPEGASVGETSVFPLPQVATQTLPSHWRRMAWVGLAVVLLAAGWLAAVRWQSSNPGEPATQQALPSPAQPDTPPAAAAQSPEVMGLEQSEPVRSAATPPARPPSAAAVAASSETAQPARQVAIQQLFDRAAQAVHDGRLDAAIAAYEDVLALEPNNAKAAVELAMTRAVQLLEGGDYDGAIRTYQQVLALAPDEPRIREGLDRARQAQAAEQRVLRRLNQAP